MNYEQIPAELRALPQWVCFMLVDNPERGKPEKIPINPHTLRGASSTNPKAWGTLEQAAAQIGKTGSCKRKGGVTVSAAVCGVGFVFNGSGITGIDFDHVIDEQGRLEPWVADWVQRFGSYTEYSPSGTGLHILCRGALGDRKCIKREEVEIYDRARYFTVTGKPYGDAKPLCDAQAALDDLYAAFEKKPTEGSPAPATGALSWDAEIGSSQASSGAGKDYLAIGLEKDSKFRELWDGHRPHGNESADDQALMNKLAYWCNCNAAAMMNAFKQSPHCQQKDPYHMEKAVVREDYLQRTVEQAVKGCTRTAEYDDLNYQDRQRASAAQDFAGIGSAGDVPEPSEDGFASFDGFEEKKIFKTAFFEPGVLPGLLDEYGKAISESIQVTADMPYLSILGVGSLCVQKKVKIRPKAGWLEPVNLYEATMQG